MMGKLQIEPYNFHTALSNIERFLQNLPTNSTFDKVEVESGLWNLFNHKVTGEEMNSFIGKVEDRFIEISKTFRSVFGEIEQVYKAFNALDEEYVAGIIQSVEEANKASQVADKASQDNTKTIERLDKAIQVLKNFKDTVTVDLSSLVSLNKRIACIEHNIGAIVDTGNDLKNIQLYFSNLNHIKDIDQIWYDLYSLKQFYTQLESYQHLNDIDSIWSDLNGFMTTLTSINLQIDAFIEEVNQKTVHTDGNIESLNQYHTLLESYQHLGDIDTIWNDVEEHKENITLLHQQVDDFVKMVRQKTSLINGDIEELKQYRILLESYEHLRDVDTIWNDLEDHKMALLDLHEKLDAFINKTRSEQDRINVLIHQMEDDNNLVRQQYNKKNKIAYWVGGSAVALTVLNYILQIVGVL